jgi:hypothetical protein
MMKNKINSLLTMSFDVAEGFSMFAAQHHPSSGASQNIRKHIEELCEKHRRTRTGEVWLEDMKEDDDTETEPRVMKRKRKGNREWDSEAEIGYVD